ncbi:MAG: type IX secretion system outer membrane channel protein PorV [Hymenobacteraceae bacterium]|nr:type IX secretion system outer membrane channel protein PorV [Hymenobacteraceae bacterium]
MRRFSRAAPGLLFALALTPVAALAQVATPVRVITTAVPVLTISPDSRAAGLGEAGVATSPDPNATYWNAAKLGFVQHKYGFSTSYTPWLRNITDDMGLAYLSGYRRLTPGSAFALSMLYFNLGEINFRDQSNGDLGTFSPKEYSISAAYGQKLSPYFGLGIAARFINSNLTGGINLGGNASRPGRSAAVDLGAYYTRDVNFGANTGNISFGANVSNIGGKITYTVADQKDFLPTNLRLGTAITYDLDPFNKITLAVDVNKLLVPTPADEASAGSKQAAAVANQALRNKGIVSAMFTSFNDAPGGASEELKEINICTGVEYWYNNLLAVRGGYFYENPSKGDRQYLSMGLGLRYQVFGVDAAYLLPNKRTNPLSNTIRISLVFSFDGQEEEKGPASPAAE